jgi:serine/threonine protein phosphatase PrpC
MRIQIISLKGHRKTNEDSEVVEVNLDGKDKTKGIRNMYSIFDGHGNTNGKIISSFLSKVMAQQLMDTQTEFPLKKSYIKNLYSSVQELIKTKLPKYAEHNGSTALIAVQYIHNGSQYLDILNTGDCRVILCKEQKSIAKLTNLTVTKQEPSFISVQISKDHKPNTPEEQKRIIALGGKDKIKFDGFDHRICDLSVSRSFGDFDAAPYVTFMPDLFRYKIDKEDRFLILGCDGLYDSLTNQAIVDFVISHCYDINTWKKKETKENIAKKLGEYAIRMGSTDNISVIIIFFD